MLLKVGGGGVATPSTPPLGPPLHLQNLVMLAKYQLHLQEFLLHLHSTYHYHHKNFHLVVTKHYFLCYHSEIHFIFLCPRSMRTNFRCILLTNLDLVHYPFLFIPLRAKLQLQ